MSNIIGNLAKAAVLIVGIPVLCLLAYDLIAVRPHIEQIREILAQADPQDASPPETVRKLIDANAGSPAPHATRLVTSGIYPRSSQGTWHVRNALWQILLPMHLKDSELYGLYATLSYNGTDKGLSNFSLRQYGQPLNHLTPTQAATTVAMTHAPTLYMRDPERLAQRASVLLDKAGYAP